MGLFKLFNSFQITALFALFPYLLQWINSADFPAHSVAFWVGIVIYLVFFVIMTAMVFNSVDDK